LGEIPNTNRVDNFGYDFNDVFDAWDCMVAAAEQVPISQNFFYSSPNLRET
jgi:hypothetical protein